MFKKVLLVVIFPVSFVGIVKLLSFTGTEAVLLPDQEYTQLISENYNVFALPIPEELNFAGEPVPVDNFEVRERFDRELLVNTYWQSQTLLFFKRANRWFPLIERILQEQGVPDDFKYLALIESGLMNEVSPAGAAGYWQILQSTGRELGLEVNTEVDERYHVEKATIAACRFLKSAYQRYNSWTLAAAAYNMGRSGINRQITNQQAGNYYDLWLNDETSRYVFRILAIKTIFENPSAHGFRFRQEDLYQPYDYYTVKVDTTISDLVTFAHAHHITYKELRTLNPWLRRTSLPNRSGKEYEIKITKESLFGRQQPIIVEEGEDDGLIMDSPARDTDL
ncbi:MAG: lytic transglycosylase domain-containing protein [Bacteroidetes bacterium]|nr:MAG: lytic transglycosylase domain-containing protein [Bacteroidota bacterium]